MSSSFKEWLGNTLKSIIVERDKRILELEEEIRTLKLKLDKEQGWYSSSDSDSDSDSYDYYGYPRHLFTKVDRDYLYIKPPEEEEGDFQ